MAFLKNLMGARPAATYDIGVSYVTDVPDELILSLAEDLRNAKLRVKTESRPNEPFVALEWAIPTAIIIYVAKPYVDTLLKEAATDHYRLLKAALSKFVQLALTVKRRMIVSAQSPHKLRAYNKCSTSFSIMSETLDGRSIKFLFLPDRSEDYYQNCTEAIFAALKDHALNCPNDDISNLADRLPHKSPEIYMLFDESSKTWKPADIVTGLAGDLRNET